MKAAIKVVYCPSRLSSLVASLGHRVAVLVDKPPERKVDLQTDYFGLAVASKELAGYGLSRSRGRYRNPPYVGHLSRTARGVAGRRATWRTTVGKND